MSDPLTRLGSALDDLCAQDLSGRFGPELLDQLAGLLTAANRLAARIARTVRECELTGAAEHDGLASMAAWLRGHARYSAAAAARTVRAGRALASCPRLQRRLPPVP